MTKSLVNKIAMMGVFLSLLFVGIGGNSTLNAKNKKHKNVQVKKAKQKYENLRQDYQMTMENFVMLLQRLVTVYDELNVRILELESKTIQHQDALFQIRDVFEKKSMEDETFRIGINLPFYEDPYYIKAVRIERHTPTSDSNP